MTSSHSNNASRSLFFGTTVIALAHLPGSIIKTLWMDDYPFLLGIFERNPAVTNFMLGSARPFQAMTSEFMMRLSDSTVWSIYPSLKLLGFLGVLFTYFAIYSRWRNMEAPETLFIFAAISLCLPTFQTYTFWSSAWTYAWSPFLSVLTLNLLNRERHVKLIYPIATCVVSLFIYPPGSFFFFGILAVEYLSLKKTNRDFLQILIKSSQVVFLSSILHIILFNFYTHQYSIDKSARSQLVDIADLPDKVLWFMSRVTTGALLPFWISKPTLSIMLLGSVPISIGLLYAVIKKTTLTKSNPLLISIFTISSLFLSSSYALLLKENQFEFRFFPDNFGQPQQLDSSLFLTYVGILLSLE